MYKIKSIEIDQRKADIYIPQNTEKIEKSVFVQDAEIFKNISERLFLEMSNSNMPLIIAIDGKNRNADYTPWHSRPENPKYPEFEGKADKYLDFIVNTLKPYIEFNYPNITSHTISGYSLGGLFSLYAASKASCFDKCVSMSGSFWYSGWLDYLHMCSFNKNISVYLNCGKKEGSLKNGLAKGNYGFTCLTYEALLKKGLKEVKLELDNKNHLNYTAERFIKAFKWIIKD